MAAIVAGAVQVRPDNIIQQVIDFRGGSVDLGQFDVSVESSGTVTIDTTNGIKLLATDANKETEIATLKLFGITAHTSRPSYAKVEAQLKLVRDADLDSAIHFGFSTGAAGDLCVDTTGAVCASFDGAVFHLPIDILALQTTASNLTTQSTVTGEATITDGSWFKLGIEILDVYTRDGGTTYYCTIRWFVNDTLVRQLSDYAIASWGPFPIRLAIKSVSANDHILYCRQLAYTYDPGDADVDTLVGTIS